MNNYETTRSDEFCEFDREIIQNTTQSCFTKSENIWLKNMRLIKFDRHLVLYKHSI